MLVGTTSARQLAGEGSDSRAHRGLAGHVVDLVADPVLNDAPRGVAVDGHLAEKMRRRHHRDRTVLFRLLGDVGGVAVAVGCDLADLEAWHGLGAAVKHQPALGGELQAVADGATINAERGRDRHPASIAVVIGLNSLQERLVRKRLRGHRLSLCADMKKPPRRGPRRFEGNCVGGGSL
jgi:hypothetical protein